MSTFFYPITLISDAGTSETFEALVDTGSSFTTISRVALNSLGVQPFARVRLRLANGQLTETELGAIDARIDDYAQRPIICAFGEPAAPPIMGAHTLEAFLLGVDPDGHRLVPLIGWLA